MSIENSLMVAQNVEALPDSEVVPMVVEKKNPFAIEHVCSPEQLAKTWVVFGPKHPMSKNQKRRVFILTPDQQNPHPDPEEVKNLNNLSRLILPGIQFPKLKFDLPPMKLLTKAFKLAGPGTNPNAGKNKDDEDGGGGMESWKHSFWLVPTPDGMNERPLAADGGAEVLKKRQMDAYNLMRSTSIELERKRFFHPDSLAELESQREAQMATYREIRPDITWQEVSNLMFRSALSNHDFLKIMANLPKQQGQTSVGIALSSKAWYQPKEKPSLEENEEAVKEYMEIAQNSEPKFKVNEQIVAGIMKGLRHRRVPVYGKSGGRLVLLDPPEDPMKFQCRAGDFVIATVSCNMYETGNKGQTWSVEKFVVVSQSSNEQNRELELDDKYAACDDFQIRYVPKGVKRERGVLPPPIVKVENATPTPVVIASPQPVMNVVSPEIRTPASTQDISVPQTQNNKNKKLKKERPSYMQSNEENTQTLADEFI